MNITNEQLHILRHSLGIRDDGTGNEYRNHYASDPDANLIALCELGYMVDRGEQEMWGGMHGFQVTELGKDLVRMNKPKPVKLSRGKQRYQTYLNADCGESFGEWLKSGRAEMRNNE